MHTIFHRPLSTTADKRHRGWASRLWISAITVMLTVSMAHADYVPHDYVWTTPSANSSESMPCGGGDVGMNVWVENGDVMFYISKSGMFDENNTLLKAGRFRLSLSPCPFPKGKNQADCEAKEPTEISLAGNNDGANAFEQRLCLDDGAIYIKGSGVTIRLWADVYEPVVFMQINCKKPLNATLSYESWRYRDREVTKAECQQCSYKWVLPKGLVTRMDSIEAVDGRLTFTHTNAEETVFDFTVSRERLDSVKDKLYNPIGGLRFGGEMTVPGFLYKGTSDGVYASTDYRAWTFQADNIKDKTVIIRLFTEQKDKTATADMTTTKAVIGQKTAETGKTTTAKQSERRSAQWWHAFWQRSWITADGAGAAMARNYELYRYMLGCNAMGEWPTKFNGGLFTFDPVYVDEKCPFTPDYRRWGGGTMTAQNQRLVYWPMLKSGDWDMMAAQWDTYLRMLPSAKARTEHYWGHEGAAFTEQTENFGLPNPAEYGKHKDGDDWGTERNAWLEYEWDTALEFCSMMLWANKYGGVDIGKYVPLIRDCIVFFDEHYQWLAKRRGVKALDGDGKLILFPSSGCETYKMAYNPASVTAALQTVVGQCLDYDRARGSVTGDSIVDSTAVILPDYSIRKRLPDIPTRLIDGDTCIAPAIVWARIQNVESPQLYPVFPWRVYGLGRPHLQTARNTWAKDEHVASMRSTKGWKQDNIWAACLGLPDEAMALNSEKAANGPYRFTAFHDHGYDWAPDINRAGAAMIGIQEMLLQETEDGELLLFPAWPKDIDATFRLHATGNRTIEAEIKGGKISHRVINEK